MRAHTAAAGLETSSEIARHAVAATAARATLVARLNAVLAAGGRRPFPAARLVLHSPIAARLAEAPALAVEDGSGHIRGQPLERRGGRRCRARRPSQRHGGGGCATGLPAALASTGQQKALLIGVVLAMPRCWLNSAGSRRCCCWTSDRAFGRRAPAALFATLLRLPAQAVLTGADRDTFLPLRGLRRLGSHPGHAVAGWRLPAGRTDVESPFRFVGKCRIVFEPSAVLRAIREERAMLFSIDIDSGFGSGG